MILSPEEEAYLSGTPNEVQAGSSYTQKMSSLWESAKSTIGGYLNWGSNQDQAQGIYLDYAESPYFSGAAATKQDVSGNRLNTLIQKDPSGQIKEGCAWYSALNPFSQCNAITKAATEKVSSVTASAGSFVQSTLIKTIVLVVIVGVIALFLMSYVQAKGVQVAKAS